MTRGVWIRRLREAGFSVEQEALALAGNLNRMDLFEYLQYELLRVHLRGVADGMIRSDRFEQAQEILLLMSAG